MPDKEQHSDLDGQPLSDAAADAVRGGASGATATQNPKPILKPISPRTIVPCV